VVLSEERSRIPDGLAPDGIAAKGRILDMLAMGTSGPAPHNVIPETGTTPRIIAAEIQAIEDVGGLPALLQRLQAVIPARHLVVLPLLGASAMSAVKAPRRPTTSGPSPRCFDG
jgi:hypothetical protein